MIAIEMSGKDGKMERWKDGKMERWKDGNRRGICPELHFFGLLHSKMSPIWAAERE
jgi:hypothetical protein